MRSGSTQHILDQRCKRLTAVACLADDLPRVPFARYQVEIEIRKHDGRPEWDAGQRRIYANDLLTETMHRVRSLLERASRIALRIAPVVPQTVLGASQGMTGFHFETKHAERRNNYHEVRLSDDLADVI